MNGLLLILLFISGFSSLFLFVLKLGKREGTSFLFSLLKLNILPEGLFPENNPVSNNGLLPSLLRLLSNFSLFWFLKIFSNGDMTSFDLLLFFGGLEL